MLCIGLLWVGAFDFVVHFIVSYVAHSFMRFSTHSFEHTMASSHVFLNKACQLKSSALSCPTLSSVSLVGTNNYVTATACLRPHLCVNVAVLLGARGDLSAIEKPPVAKSCLWTTYVRQGIACVVCSSAML